MKLIDADVLIKKIINEGVLGDGYSNEEIIDDIKSMVYDCVNDNIDISKSKQHIYIDCCMDDCIHNNSFGDCGLVDNKCIRLESDFYQPSNK